MARGPCGAQDREAMASKSLGNQGTLLAGFTEALHLRPRNL